MTRILVPTDFSEPSRAALRYGLELATAAGGDVVLLHVVEGMCGCSYAVGGPPQAPRDYIDPRGDVFRLPFAQKFIYRDLCEEARWKLETLFSPGYQNRIHTVVTVGKAAEEIVRVAKEQHVDLILMGTAGRRHWWQVFRSTVTDRVSRKATVPVITVDASARHVERQPAHPGIPDQPTGGGRAAFHNDGWSLAVEERAPARHRSTVAATTERREKAADDPEQPMLSHSTMPDERGGRQANGRHGRSECKGPSVVLDQHLRQLSRRR